MYLCEHSLYALMIENISSKRWKFKGHSTKGWVDKDISTRYFVTGEALRVLKELR